MRLLPLFAFAVAAAAAAQQPFTIEQALSAPYSTNLTAAPVENMVAWVEHVQGRNNLWVGSTFNNAHPLTHNIEDDAQDITSLAWSPDGKWIAYVFGAQTGASGKPANPAHLQRPTPVEILMQPIAGGDPIHVGEGRTPLFARDGKTLYFVRGGQIMQVGVSYGKVPPPSLVVFDRGSASSVTLSADGKKLAYISHRRTHSFVALFDLETKTLTFPAPSTGNDSAPIFSRDGKYLAWLRWPWTDANEFETNRVSPNPWSIQAMEITSGKTWKVFQPEAKKPGSAEPRMSTGEPHLYFTAENRVLFFSEPDGWVHLYSVDVEGVKPPVLLTPGEFEVEDAVLNPQGTALYYAANAKGSSETNDDRRHIWTVALQGPSAPRQVTTKLIETHPQVTPDGVVFVLMSSDRYPMFPAQLMKPSGWVSLRYDPQKQTDAVAEKFVAPERVLFPSSDKLFQLHGQLFLPRAAPSADGKRPAILFFHGGPRRQLLLGYPSMDYYSNAYAMNQYLASRGYIVLSVNYRGGIGYGLNFRQCEHCGGDGAAEYADALGAVAYLKSRPDVDASRIGIWGGSYGGYFTALGLARNSDLFAAGVDFHGVHEWAREDNAPGDWLRSATNDPDEVAQIAKKAHESSPMADVAKWKSPVLFIHGDDDPDVAYIQTPMLADALRARNVHVEELIFPDELHGFVLHKDWVKAYEATADFFDRTLKRKP